MTRDKPSTQAHGWKIEIDGSDRHINELCQRYGYVHPLAIAARLEQWINRYSGEDSGTLVMGEAARALRKANDLQRDIETLLTMLGNHEYAEHWAKTEIGKRLESAMTTLHGELNSPQTQEPAPDLIRIDTVLPNGVPDCEYITHDAARRLLSNAGDLRRRWIELRQIVITAPEGI